MTFILSSISYCLVQNVHCKSKALHYNSIQNYGRILNVCFTLDHSQLKLSRTGLSIRTGHLWETNQGKWWVLIQVIICPKVQLPNVVTHTFSEALCIIWSGTFGLTFCVSNCPLNDMVHDGNGLFTGCLSKIHGKKSKINTTVILQQNLKFEHFFF